MDRLDSAEPPPNKDLKQREYPYRRKGLVVDILQPGAATPTRYAVQPRRINETELKFLHGSFLHTSTSCCIQLVTLHGTWCNVTGTVSHCCYVEENIHDISVALSHRIEPALFCPEAGRSSVLLVEEDDSLARLAEHHLSNLNADVEHISDFSRVCDLAMKNRYDVIFIDVHTTDGKGRKVVQELRAQGYSRSIVDFSLQVEDGIENKIAEGCDMQLAKPFTQEDIRELLSSLRQEPLFSSFYSDLAMADLINTFVQELSGCVCDMEKAVLADDMEGLRKLIRSVRSQGSSYGFEVLTDAARSVETAMTSDEITKEVRTELDALVKLCMQARCAEAGTSP